MINQDIGMINDNTEMIESSTGMINDNTEMITETNDTKCAVNGRRERSRERGKESKLRNYPLHTTKNLPQFRNKSHEEIRQHIPYNCNVLFFNMEDMITWYRNG